MKPLGHLKKHYAERLAVPVTSLCFLLKNHPVADDSTAASLGMADGDIVHIFDKIQLRITSPV